MRKLILGIIAVFCVQFAFMIYMQLQSPLYLAAAPDQPEFPALNADLSWVHEFDRYGLGPIGPEVEQNASEQPRNGVSVTTTLVAGTDRPERSERLHAPRSRIERPVRKDSTFFSPDYEKLKAGGFETVVISYNRNPETSPCDRPNVARYKKRLPVPIVAKAVNSRWELIKSDLPRLY